MNNCYSKKPPGPAGSALTWEHSLF